MNENNHRMAWIKRNTAALTFGAAVLLLLTGAALGAVADRRAEATPVQETGASDAVRVSDTAELLQTLTYSRCEHTVTRRLTAPVELYGLTLEEVTPLYPEWQITQFGAEEIHMTQRPELFCPDHLVLMADGAGRLCIFRNKYGDALALEKELDSELSSFPAAVQEELSLGMGFSTAEELSAWLESAES